MARRKRQAPKIIPTILTDPLTGDDFTVEPINGESQVAYRAFLDYCSMERPGVNRLLKRYQRDKTLIVQASEGPDGGFQQFIPVKPPTTNKTTIYRWADKYEWATRSDLYRELIIRIKRAGMVQHLFDGIHSLSGAFKDLMMVTQMETQKMLAKSIRTSEPVYGVGDLVLAANRLTRIMAYVAEPTDGQLNMSGYTRVRGEKRGDEHEDGMDIMDAAFEILSDEHEKALISFSQAKQSNGAPASPYDEEV